MPLLQPSDHELLEDLFEMREGFVLDFTSRGFRDFFNEKVQLDIDDPVYRRLGRSKAKRLRCFLRDVDPATAIAALDALWDYRELMRQIQERGEWVARAEPRFRSLMRRLQAPESTLRVESGVIEPADANRRKRTAGTQASRT